MSNQPDMIAQGTVVAAMWSYAFSVLYPMQAAMNMGLLPRPRAIGNLPRDWPERGLGRRFSLDFPEPLLLHSTPQHSHLVAGFDENSSIYDFFCLPFSRPIFDEAIATIRSYVEPAARVLDAGCGPGRAVRRIARLVPQGEVVGIDLSAEMVKAAHQEARVADLKNVAFVQADAGDLPSIFDGQFDLVFSSLAHHHYPDREAAAHSVYRCLRPGGIYCVIDAGPAWFNTFAHPLASWGDPGYVAFLTPRRFRVLFRGAGFERTAWIDLLPGFGIAFGQKGL